MQMITVDDLRDKHDDPDNEVLTEDNNDYSVQTMEKGAVLWTIIVITAVSFAAGVLGTCWIIG